MGATRANHLRSTEPWDAATEGAQDETEGAGCVEARLELSKLAVEAPMDGSPSPIKSFCASSGFT